MVKELKQSALCLVVSVTLLKPFVCVCSTVLLHKCCTAPILFSNSESVSKAQSNLVYFCLAQCVIYLSGQ